MTASLAAILLAAALSGCAAKSAKDRFGGLPAERIYEVAMQQMEREKYGKARATLEKALGRQDTTPELVARVHLALADAYYHDGGILNLAEALSRYTNFLTFYPRHSRADYAQYQLGLCYLKQALNPDRDQVQTRKALGELIKVISQYPGSDYLVRAEEKASEARELLAEHDFRIAGFYFRRKAYPGAVDRLRSLLEEYPRFSRCDRIYLMLGRSLMAMKRNDEGRLYLEKVLAEYPDTRTAGEARFLLDHAAAGGGVP